MGHTLRMCQPGLDYLHLAGVVFAHKHWSISWHSIYDESWLLVHVLTRRNILNVLNGLLLWYCELGNLFWNLVILFLV
jgi:hypothetical protein